MTDFFDIEGDDDELYEWTERDEMKSREGFEMSLEEEDDELYEWTDRDEMKNAEYEDMTGEIL